MISQCPQCGYKNDTHLNRKKKFKISDLFGVYIPFVSKDISEFRNVVCGKCNREYVDNNITLFGISKEYGWVLPALVILLFIYMLYVGYEHGK
jgi:Na+-transporting NADH:ubiquinone oxidoreductase subunit NqrE